MDMSNLWLQSWQARLAGFARGDTRREGIRVFCYHGIVERKTDPQLERNFHPRDTFAEHIRFLRQFRLLSLAELLEELSAKGDDSRPAAVVTFDDGYANNLLAAEIMAQARLPWTVFLTTGALGRDGIIPLIELSLLLLHGQARNLEALGQTFQLPDTDRRLSAFRAIRAHLKTLPANQREQSLDAIRAQFPVGETQRLLHVFPSLQMMSWNEARQLAGAGVDLGSHGVAHEIHHAGQPEAVRQHELGESRRRMEKQLGQPCLAFAFPNGNTNPASASELETAGYRLGFTTRPGTARRAANPWLLPRLEPAGAIGKLAREFYWEPKTGGKDAHE